MPDINEEAHRRMTPFRLLRVFNDEAVRGYANAKAKIGRNALPYFQGNSLQERIVRALADERALPMKEVTEAFEFFAVTRRYIERTPVVVDLCSGHGLAGILFAAFSRHVEQVLLCDRRRPQNFEPVMRACTQAAGVSDRRSKVFGVWIRTPLDRSDQ